MFRLVAYNFLSGGSARRSGHWSRLLKLFGPDAILGQECRPPEACAGEKYRPAEGDSLLWRAAGTSRWGSALLVRSAKVIPIEVPGYAGWVVGGEMARAGRPLRLFSVHGPAGERGYIKTMHEILDRLVPHQKGADLILGGDFNVAVGYREPADKVKTSPREREILDRLARDLGLVSSWQTANPGKRLAQTLRWMGNPKTPYHCDGIFIPASYKDRLLSCRVVRGSRWNTLSDHNPVVAELDL